MTPSERMVQVNSQKLFTCASVESSADHDTKINQRYACSTPQMDC